jgi:hypothetical protein
MTIIPSDAWLRVFPALHIPEVVSYVLTTWSWLQGTYADAVTFDHNEPKLIDNLCEALNDAERRFSNRISCDFQSETRELRRNADGTTSYVARADIRVILGAPGTPHLVLEFKKLDGSPNARRLYCFDGLSRFVEGKYAVDHAHGVMCGLVCVDTATESAALKAYISDLDHAGQLACIPSASGEVIIAPSVIAPADGDFDTLHARKSAPAKPIAILHVLMTCARSKSVT